MFQSNKLIQRFHHLYLIQALVEIQRHCNNLYLKFKHQILYVVSKRLHLSRLKLLRGSGQQQTLGYDDYFCNQSNGQGGNCTGRIAGNIIEDLNHWLINPSQGNNVSIPMQMLLLPFIVQPHGLVASDGGGGGGNVKKPDSCHMYRGGNIINNNNNNSRIECQQWHGASNVNVCAPSNYVTLVPSQMLSAQSQTMTINEHHATFMAGEQRDKMKFSSAASRADCRQNDNNGGRCNFRSAAGSSWSKAVQATSCDSYGAAAANRNLSMRNPLMNYPARSRREL